MCTPLLWWLMWSLCSRWWVGTVSSRWVEMQEEKQERWHQADLPWLKEDFPGVLWGRKLIQCVSKENSNSTVTKHPQPSFVIVSVRDIQPFGNRSWLNLNLKAKFASLTRRKSLIIDRLQSHGRDSPVVLWLFSVVVTARIINITTILKRACEHLLIH